MKRPGRFLGVPEKGVAREIDGQGRVVKLEPTHFPVNRFFFRRALGNTDHCVLTR